MPDHPAPPRVALADRPASAPPRVPGASAPRAADQPARRVDTPNGGSVSFAPPDAPRDASAARPDARSGRGEGRRRPSATTAPGRGVPLLAVRPVGVLRQVSGYPIQPSKVQRPPLRDDVLSRSRLNDLLDAKSSHRVVLVVAEAGYGKTTMLADWTRRTSRRVLWYRLDSDDRDWLGFLHHIVAAGRVLDDRFGIETEELLGSLGPDGPTRDQIVASLARALSSTAAGGVTLILDDYHAVDDREDVREVLRGLIDRIADGVSILLATRTDPELPLGRYRARAEVATLTAEDLRFDESETERLFREAYQRPLEPDVLVDLSERTEGWAASLQLVRTAIEERSPAEVKRFVGRLSGARGDLHDYLAEEVMGRMAIELQDFLMRASLLESVTSETVSTVVN